MSKKKKTKVVPIKQVFQSPENYIKTQARSLPIEECVINEDWEDTGMCNIIVARRHKTGNLTLGVYLVDLYCLGVKDAHYKFNIDEDDYDYLKNSYANLESCDYVLAHNIIYGAIAFAEDYGLKPHKDFAIAQFILEEDDDNVELMELEFGLDGVPFYVKGPNDDAAKISQIKNTLLRTAGEGNFKVLEDIDDFDLDLVEDDDNWPEDDDYEEELSDEQEDILNDLLFTVKPVNKAYEKAVRNAEGNEMLKKSTIGKGYRLTENPVENQYDLFVDATEQTVYEELMALFEDTEFDQAIPGLKKAIATYPDSPRFYNLLQACYFFNEEKDKSHDLSLEMYKKFPDYIFALIPYVNLLIDENKAEEALSIFKGHTDLNELYPGREQFNRHEAAIYFATMCRCFVALDNIDAADLYMNAIFKKDLQHVPNQTLVNKALMELCGAKIEKIKLKIGWDE